MKNYLVEDKKAKSKSFFFREENIVFNRKFISFAKLKKNIEHILK